VNLLASANMLKTNKVNRLFDYLRQKQDVLAEIQ